MRREGVPNGAWDCSQAAWKAWAPAEIEEQECHLCVDRAENVVHVDSTDTRERVVPRVLCPLGQDRGIL